MKKNFLLAAALWSCPAAYAASCVECHKTVEHRMRVFQGTFHANPDYALWYGWSEMQRDLTEIKTMAVELRKKHIPATK